MPLLAPHTLGPAPTITVQRSQRQNMCATHDTSLQPPWLGGARMMSLSCAWKPPKTTHTTLGGHVVIHTSTTNKQEANPYLDGCAVTLQTNDLADQVVRAHAHQLVHGRACVRHDPPSRSSLPVHRTTNARRPAAASTSSQRSSSVRGQRQGRGSHRQQALNPPGRGCRDGTPRTRTSHVVGNHHGA